MGHANSVKYSYSPNNSTGHDKRTGYLIGFFGYSIKITVYLINFFENFAKKISVHVLLFGEIHPNSCIFKY